MDVSVEVGGLVVGSDVCADPVFGFAGKELCGWNVLFVTQVAKDDGGGV